jgi:ribosome recycling factor
MCAAAAQRQPRHAAVRLQEADPDPKAVISDAEQKMKKSVASVQDSLSTLRVGRASPSLLDRVVVDYYGAETPLNQLASVTASSASQLVVDVYDKSALGDVEKALYESDLGMTPNSDGKVIRLNVPALTEERRKELAKSAKSLGEDGKVAIRNVRKAAIEKIKKMKKALGEDAVKDGEDSIQKAVKKYEGEVGDAVAEREKEIMTV